MNSTPDRRYVDRDEEQNLRRDAIGCLALLEKTDSEFCFRKTDSFNFRLRVLNLFLQLDEIEEAELVEPQIFGLGDIWERAVAHPRTAMLAMELAFGLADEDEFISDTPPGVIVAYLNRLVKRREYEELFRIRATDVSKQVRRMAQWRLDREVSNMTEPRFFKWVLQEGLSFSARLQAIDKLRETHSADILLFINTVGLKNGPRTLDLEYAVQMALEAMEVTPARSVKHCFVDKC
jgi:hypothetical protein